MSASPGSLSVTPSLARSMPSASFWKMLLRVMTLSTEVSVVELPTTTPVALKAMTFPCRPGPPTMLPAAPVRMITPAPPLPRSPVPAAFVPILLPPTRLALGVGVGDPHAFGAVAGDEIAFHRVADPVPVGADDVARHEPGPVEEHPDAVRHGGRAVDVGADVIPRDPIVRRRVGRGEQYPGDPHAAAAVSRDEVPLQRVGHPVAVGPDEVVRRAVEEHPAGAVGDRGGAERGSCRSCCRLPGCCPR